MTWTSWHCIVMAIAGDGTHPGGTTCRDKVARLLLGFCKTDLPMELAP